MHVVGEYVGIMGSYQTGRFLDIVSKVIIVVAIEPNSYENENLV